MTTLVQLPHDDVVAIASEVWASYVSPDQPLIPMDAGDFPVGWSALVAVSGAWAGVIIIDLLDTAAWSLTTQMFGDDAAEADMADAVGELVNMIGGNVKAILNSESNLSLPVVAAGQVWAPSGADEVVRAELASATGPIRVRVCQLRVQPHGVL